MCRLLDKGEFIFFLALIPWVLIRTLFTTGVRDFFPNEGVFVYRIVFVFALIMALLKVILERYYLAPYLISFAIIFCLVGVAGIVSGRQALILNCLLVFAAGNIPTKKILGVSLLIMGGTLLLTQLADSFSWYQAYDSLREDGRIRYALGFLFITYGPNLYFHFVVIYQAWRGKHIREIEFICLAVIACYYYLMTDTKSAFYFTLLALIVGLVLKYIKGYRLEVLIEGVSQHIVALSAMVAIGLTWLYGQLDPQLNRLDQVLTGRLALARQGFQTYDILLFGQPIEFVGYNEVRPYFYLDFSFVNILLNYGIVLLVLLILGYYLLVKCQRLTDTYVQVALILIALHSIFDPQFIEIEYNSLLLLLGGLFYGPLVDVRQATKQGQTVYSIQVRRRFGHDQ